MPGRHRKRAVAARRWARTALEPEARLETAVARLLATHRPGPAR
jgi:hypothetical protein